MLRHVYSHKDSNALCDIAEEVERLYGFGCCVVSLSTVGASSLSVDSRFPRWELAYEYARELVMAAQAGRKAYQAALRV